MHGQAAGALTCSLIPLESSVVQVDSGPCVGNQRQSISSKITRTEEGTWRHGDDLQKQQSCVTLTLTFGKPKMPVTLSTVGPAAPRPNPAISEHPAYKNLTVAASIKGISHPESRQISMFTFIIAVAVAAIVIHRLVYIALILDPESKLPGPKAFALTRWRLAFSDWTGTRTQTIHKLHQEYGPAIRIGPKELHFNSLSALKTIYGAGSKFGRTSFYRMFDVYGKQNLFTFHSSKQHGERKKLVANAYSKSLMLKGDAARMVEEKVREYMALLSVSSTEDKPNEIFTSLHYFSLDSITAFLYGPHFGGTSTLTGTATHRALLNDIVDPARRKLSWFAVHLPSLTRWLYTRTKILESLISPFLPMQKPATYTGIRAHALAAFQSFRQAAESGDTKAFSGSSIISQLWKHSSASKEGGLEDLEIAAECADHLLAGIDTTSDTVMYLIWALSLPRHLAIQERLIAEARAMEAVSLNEEGLPTVEGADKLVYLEAVIKETLRLYAPLPASEPRSCDQDTMIDGFAVPAGTVVSIAPYSLHRNADIFEDPLSFKPERWIAREGYEDELAKLNRWFWAFSSGGRMCIGLQ